MDPRLDSLHHRPFNNVQFKNDLSLDSYGLKDAADKAYKDVVKARESFDKLDKEIDGLFSQRSAFLIGEAVYRGLFDDFLNYGVHSIEKMAISDDNLDTLVQEIKDNNSDKVMIDAVKNRVYDNIAKGNIPIGKKFHITKLSDAFLKSFAAAPDKTGSSANTAVPDKTDSSANTAAPDKTDSSTKSEDNKLKKGIVTTNTSIISIIAREAVFYVLFTKSYEEYKKKLGSIDQAKSGTATLQSRLADLQNAIRRYNKLNSQFPIIVPGMMSATQGEMLYANVLRELQIATANRENAVNSANANILLREIAQQVTQELRNISNSLDKQDDQATVNLKDTISRKTILLIDNYRFVKGGNTMSEEYGSLLPTLNKGGTKMTLKELNTHTSALSKMIKLLSDEGSQKMLEIQDISFKKNTVTEELSRLMRRIFTALDVVFGLPSD